MRKPLIEAGQIYSESDDPREMWRVEKVLSDGIHVALVNAQRPSRRKTFSVWAIANRRYFMPAERRSN